jgi:hypothetical protein
MKRFKLMLSLAACVALGSVQAQTVGTIGVGDISFSAKGDQPRSKESVISAIESGLNSALKETRKFSVLDYAQLSERIGKQGLSLDGYYNKTYSGTEYSQAGLDYILTANVTEFGFVNKAGDNPENTHGSINIEFKLIGVADLTSDIDSVVTAQSSKAMSLNANDTSEEVLDDVVQRAVYQLVDQVVTGLFPIRVMQVTDNGEVLLNYGDGLLSPGDMILVYKLDEEAAVNEVGQAAGESVATLQITSTEKKFSSAKIISGFANIVAGQQAQLLLSGG